MMAWCGAWRRGGTVALLAIAAAVPAASQGPELELLSRLERGRWELRDLNNEQVLRASFCIGDSLLLTQPQHGAAPCTRVVISAGPDSATVHYTCPSAGFGRTTIRYETPRLVRIDSQGIDRSVPFGFRAEARRVGPCGNGGGGR